ncbi:MAG: hypothetical protein KDH15_16690 [Rhodocyclaceae bacterium]|nr:hypothetical protein [Rhodocyclaceae bacterium]
MKRTFVAAMLAWSITLPAFADDAATPLWETESAFRQPESVLLDARRQRLYVSNIDGGPLDKDGRGFVSTLGTDGKLQQLEWVGGLNAPKGMALVGDRLFVSDVDVLVEIDVDKGTILKRYAAADARFLNDVAADADGRIYVSDMITNRIYRLAEGRLESWLESPQLANPNGLAVVGERLFVATWGVMEADFSTKVPGHVLTVSLGSRSIADFGGTGPVGNLDGIEALADGSVLVSDWMAGGLMRVSSDGGVARLAALAPGSADIGIDAAGGLVWVPMMKEGTVRALRLGR